MLRSSRLIHIVFVDIILTIITSIGIVGAVPLLLVRTSALVVKATIISIISIIFAPVISCISFSFFSSIVGIVIISNAIVIVVVADLICINSITGVRTMSLCLPPDVANCLVQDGPAQRWVPLLPGMAPAIPRRKCGWPGGCLCHACSVRL